MKTAIVYASKYGCTEICAQQLAEQLAGEVVLYNLKDKRRPCIGEYDVVIIGGSIYIGKIQKMVRTYCEKHAPALSEKKVGFFVCCSAQNPKAYEYLKTSFPAELLGRAAAKAALGGHLPFDKMSWIERKMLEMVQKQTGKKMEPRIDEEEIREFADKLNM